jgi:hypothetical protein
LTLLLLSSCSTHQAPAVSSATPQTTVSATPAATSSTPAAQSESIPRFCTEDSPVVADPGDIHAFSRPKKVGGFTLQPDNDLTKSTRAPLLKVLQRTGGRLVAVDAYASGVATAVVSVAVVQRAGVEYYQARANLICSSAVKGTDLRTARAVRVPGFTDPVICFGPSTDNGLTRTQCGWLDDYGVSISLFGPDSSSQAQRFALLYRQGAER